MKAELEPRWEKTLFISAELFSNCDNSGEFTLGGALDRDVGRRWRTRKRTSVFIIFEGAGGIYCG